jgi:predicted metalloendopeptidase
MPKPEEPPAMIRRSLSLAILLALGACSSTPPVSKPAAAPAAAAPAVPAAVTRPSGLMLDNFDRSVRPQDDLYRFTNGGWLSKTEIPADKSNYGSFTVLADGAEKNLRAIAEESAAAGAGRSAEQQLIGDFYASYLDEARAEELGIKPLEPELARIDAIRDRKQLLAYLARASTTGISTPIDASIFADAKNPEINTLWLGQGGFGLPERDYYFSQDARMKQIRTAYETHIANVFNLAGRKDGAGAARRVMAFETRLAKASWPAVRLREIEKLYNPYSVAAAQQATPGIDWTSWLATQSLPTNQQIVVTQPDYFREVGKAINDVPLETWKDYLRLRTIDSFAPYLSKAFVDENFNFYAKTLSGVPQLRPRWKRALGEMEGSMGDLLGKEYVSRHFPPEAKVRMDALVGNLLKAFESSIGELEWMGPDTRKQAYDKIRNFTVKIGYPTKWKEYPGLTVRRDDLVGNVMRAREVNTKREIAKMGKPVDKTEWGMTPQTVNAYYNPLANEIVFPAAILQPPFFDMNADDAVNYGGIGAVIGHEISHGFDDQGRKFDGKGVLRDWWQPDDNKRFEERAGALVSQYNAFSPLPGQNVNGQLTLGENIGDLSGLAVAYKAYQIALGGQSSPVIDGFTGEQRFFLGWAQVWARKYRDDELVKRLKTDPHSPSEYRCNGIVRNQSAFVRAFGVKEGDKLYLPPDKQVRLW